MPSHLVSAWHEFRQKASFSFFQNVVTSPFCGGREGAEALAALSSQDSSLFSPHLLHDFMVPGTSFVCFHPRVGWAVSSVAEPIQSAEELESHCNKESRRNSTLKQARSGTQRTSFSTHFLIVTASQFYLMSKKNVSQNFELFHCKDLLQRMWFGDLPYFIL